MKECFKGLPPAVAAPPHPKKIPRKGYTNSFHHHLWTQGKNATNTNSLLS